MKDSRIELKVGLFVAVGLVLLALLVLEFNKGFTMFNHYTLYLRLPNAAGIKRNADVMMAGVPIGEVADLKLEEPEDRTVLLTVKIDSAYKIRTNASIHVDALGFLGDQYIEVTPSTNVQAGFWKDGDTVVGEAPFNMQEAVRSVSGLVDTAKKTANDIDQMFIRINKTFLNDETLTNFLTNLTATLSNADVMTRGAVTVIQDAQILLHTNTNAFNATVSNLVAASAKLDTVADKVDSLIATNRDKVNEAIQNLRDTSASARQIAADLQAGKGMAGTLLKDSQMQADTKSLVSNANATAASINTFFTNLDQYGLWHMLWKQKPAKGKTEPAR
jgi:phospholipid/cholesterol/gamma-HCH transport system substrate-binding protein